MDVRGGIAVVGALLALVLQIVVAPNIAIMGTMPHFIIAYVLVVGILLPGVWAYGIAFALGLFADLLGYGPVGALPFILLLSLFLLDYAHKTFGNGTLFVSCVVLLAFVIVVHFLHASFMVAISSAYSAADAFLLIAIPQSLYDCVLAVLVYVLLRRMFNSGQASMTQIGSHI